MNTSSLSALDPENAATAWIDSGSTPVLASLAWDEQSGTLFATDTMTQELLRVDPATGSQSVVGNMNLEFPHGSAVDPNTGTLYVTEDLPDDGGTLLHVVDKTTGTATLVGSMGFAHINSLDFDPTTGVLYGGYGWSEQAGFLVTIDVSTGAATFVAPTRRLTALSFDSSGQLYGVDNGLSFLFNSSFFSIDKASGQDVLVGEMALNNVLGVAFRGEGFGDRYCQAEVNSTGAAASISVSGSPYIADNNFTLSAGPVPDQPFIFYYGEEQVQLPFGNGIRCVGGTVVRLGPIQYASSNVATRSVDLVGLGIPPGTHNFQCWFRDPALGGFNLSDGLHVVLWD